MKIALLIKGPVRVDVETAIKNISDFKAFFSNHEMDEYVFSWNNQDTLDFANRKLAKNIVMLEEPTNNFIYSKLRTNQLRVLGTNKINAFKHYYTMKMGADFIVNTHRDYDFIFYFRLDTSYNIKRPDLWLDKENYVCGATHSNLPELAGWNLYTDIIGCGPPEIFRKVWDYESIEKLNETYAQSSFPEDWLKRNIINKNIPHKTLTVFSPLWGLPRLNIDYDFECVMDPRRHR